MRGGTFLPIETLATQLLARMTGGIIYQTVPTFPKNGGGEGDAVTLHLIGPAVFGRLEVMTTPVYEASEGVMHTDFVAQLCDHDGTVLKTVKGRVDRETFFVHINEEEAESAMAVG